MLNEWAMHDLGHIRQIAELVRARKYLAGAGPLGKILQLETMMHHDSNFPGALRSRASLAAQTFIQMSDPQFGMYTKNADFAQETANFEFAIATANRLKPAFVVITGDLINKAGDAAQAAEYKRDHRQARPEDQAVQRPGQSRRGQRADRGIAGRLSRAFRRRLLQLPRRRHRGHRAEFESGEGREEGARGSRQDGGVVRGRIGAAKRSGVKHIIVFQHISLFLKDSG